MNILDLDYLIASFDFASTKSHLLVCAGKRMLRSAAVVTLFFLLQVIAMVKSPEEAAIIKKWHPSLRKS